MNLCRADLSILNVIGYCRDALHCAHRGQLRKWRCNAKDHNARWYSRSSGAKRLCRVLGFGCEDAWGQQITESDPSQQLGANPI